MFLRVCSTVVLHARVQTRHEYEYRLLIRVQPSYVSTWWHVAGRVVTILQLPWCRCHDTRWHVAVPGGTCGRHVARISAANAERQLPWCRWICLERGIVKSHPSVAPKTVPAFIKTVGSTFMSHSSPQNLFPVFIKTARSSP